MSQSKIDRKLHAKFIAQTDDEIRSGITKILRKKFRNNPSAVKVICRDTGAALRAARNWYDGENSPSLLHFVLLARNYPELVNLFLDLCQRKPKRHQKRCRKGDVSLVPSTPTAPPCSDNLSENVPNDVPNRIDTSSCNIRQLWFINTLLEGEKVFAPDIAAHWRVTAKTAKRDITGLKSAGLITYQGTRRSGFYELAQEPEIES